MVALEAVAPYEFGEPPPFQYGAIYAAYIRGEAYFAKRDGAAAAREFQKFLDHRGLVVNYPLASLIWDWPAPKPRRSTRSCNSSVATMLACLHKSCQLTLSPDFTARRAARLPLPPKKQARPNR